MRHNTGTFFRGFALGAALMGLFPLGTYAARRIAWPHPPSLRAFTAMQAPVVAPPSHVTAPQRATPSTGSETAAVSGYTTANRAMRGAARPHTVEVTAVAVDNSSAKVDYLPVPGASDYRVMDLDNPGVVKYAGMRHLGQYNPDAFQFAMQPDGVTPVYPYTVTERMAAQGSTGPGALDVAATEIEWNMLGDGKPHRLVIQAVDQLGPAPMGSLYDGDNQPTMPPMAGMPPMPGADEGRTGDGLLSINGQGSPTNVPRVIAQSRPFVVQADHTFRALPSRPEAAQVFFDTFDRAASDRIVRVGPLDRVGGFKTYAMGAGTAHPWTIQYQGVDTDHSQPSIMDGHFMDVLFDGSTTAPKHIAHGVVALSPVRVADFSGGRVLHAAMEVDGHFSGRRWIDFNLAPADDPLTNWYGENAPVDRSDRAFFLEIEHGQMSAGVDTGPSGAADGHPTGVQLMGAPGSLHPLTSGPRTSSWGGNGRALDNRSRFDLFISTAHYAVFEDGVLVGQSDIPGGLGFDRAKVYFSHYVYHTANDHADLLTDMPWEKYWLTYFPWSDERHWDNMGFEVLPGTVVPTSNWASLAAAVEMPPSTPPHYIQ